MSRFFWMILKIIFYIPFRLLYWTRVINKKELRKHHGKGVVVVCNHKSYLDGPAMWFLFHRQFHFPVKEGVVKKGFWRWLFKGLNLFPVKRGQDLKMTRHFLSKLEKNHGVFFFPEGRRIFNPEDSLALRNGAAMIAIKGGVPIVPIVMKRAPQMFRFNKIKVGQTISTEKYQGKKLEKSDLNELSMEIKNAMTNLLDGFEHFPKPKKWETEEVENVRSILIKDDKLLLIKRVRENRTYYVFPGGHVDSGENPTDAAVREAVEETNVQCGNPRLVYKKKMHWRKQSKKMMQGFYICDYVAGEPGPTDAEEYTDTTRSNGTYEPMFVTFDELKDIDLKPISVKFQLLRDIETYGHRLERNVKLIKKGKR